MPTTHHHPREYSKVPSGRFFHRSAAYRAALSLLASFALLGGAVLIQDVDRASAATTWYVDDATCPSVGSGTIGDPFCSIQVAIDAAANGDTINVAAGIYNEDLTIDEDVTIQGQSRDTTTIDGSGAGRVIRITAGYSVTIRHVTISGGNQTGYVQGGGGLWNSGTLTLSNCIVSNNYAEPMGGGIYNDADGTMVISRCMIKENTTYHAGWTGLGGGGVYNTGTLTVLDSTVMNNHADDSPSRYERGGGVYHHDGTMTLERVMISSNSSTEYGGGVHINHDDLADSAVLINVTISGNTSRVGGGIGLTGGSVGEVTINNATIAGNTATYTTSGGGGLHAYAPVVIRNSIIDNNSAQECGGDPPTYITSDGYNLAEDSTCGFTSTGDQQSTDANLGSLQDNGGLTETMALGKGSPAIDAGNPATPGSGGSSCTALDQREWSRPIDGDLNGSARCDMGAYEATINLFLPLIMR